ncbi:uncharacterized protein LOC132066351 [Lycium ferocissimum]|uniref:uncharacterized protein LOC132066351 n=1 Tax=Lycium ferocissimum TaxID=112874 RepID=UPI0028167358|nr:uncharacterized protein LOC132066351 [Lycium ferocissimum]
MMSGGYNGHNQPDEPLRRSIREFLDMKPPVFTGASETEDPLLFLDGIQKALDALECSSTRSVELAAYCLQDIAEDWFKSLKAGRPPNSRPLTWKEFTNAFIDRFLPMSLRDALAIQFEGLRQTPQISVNEYNIQFNRLSRHAQYVMNDSMRAKRFIHGLIDPLFKPLASHLTKGDITYSQAVDVAREVETRWRDP